MVNFLSIHFDQIAARHGVNLAVDLHTVVPGLAFSNHHDTAGKAVQRHGGGVGLSVADGHALVVVGVNDHRSFLQSFAVIPPMFGLP